MILNTRSSPAGAKYSVSVAGAIVRGNGRVLVIRRRDIGAYEAPGSVLELDDSIHAGLAREITGGVRIRG